MAARYLTLVGRPNALEQDRLGIIASRRVGGAVERNRAKRRIRELFRREDPAGAGAAGRLALDVVAIARREIISAPFPVLEKDFQAALRKLRGTR